MQIRCYISYALFHTDCATSNDAEGEGIVKKAAGIGDNCIDDYTNIGRRYPTGNVVDTGVNMRKLGIPVSIISTTGSDENGRWMIDALTKEGLDLSHLKVAEGKTAITYMTLDENDRVHGEYEEGVLADMVFDDEDVRFAAEHDLVFTAFWGKAENVMGKIHDLGALTAFDYATSNDERLPAMLETTRGAIDYGFFSYKGIGSRNDPEPREFLRRMVNEYGMKVAVATFGEEGSLAYNGVVFYEGNVVPQPNVVNTVGAGDSFIAGFLAGVLKGRDIAGCLRDGARVASEVVGVFEPWVIDE